MGDKEKKISKGRILVVEDNDEVVDVLQIYLKELGYTIPAVISSGKEAVKKAAETRPDLVLMDICLDGEIDGVEAAKQIQENLNIPIVYLTDLSNAKILEKAKATEPFGYILKPFTEKDLCTTVELALHKHKMETRLKERFTTILRSISDAVIAIDEKELITFMNPVAESLTGWKQELVFGKGFKDVFKIRGLQTSALNEDTVTEALNKDIDIQKANNAILIAQNGTEIPIDYSSAPIKDNKGNNSGFITIFRDITKHQEVELDNEKLQTQQLHSQKIEAIRTLAKGLAHDFNNMITAIKGYADLALLKVGKPHPLYKNLKQIHFAAVRAANITEQLLLFSHDKLICPAWLNINTVIENLLDMLKRLLSKDIKLTTDLASDIWTVHADAGGIDQILMNLTSNAKEAMPKGGKLTITTENVILHSKDCKFIPASRSGKFVCLSVDDTGAGIDKEILTRIFEPFFTTKKVGSGTGLGLAVVYSIVKRHKGWINVYSDRGYGTRFKIYLPAIPQKADKESNLSISSHGLQGKGERILLVEDEEIVRN